MGDNYDDGYDDQYYSQEDDYERRYSSEQTGSQDRDRDFRDGDTDSRDRDRDRDSRDLSYGEKGSREPSYTTYEDDRDVERYGEHPGEADLEPVDIIAPWEIEPKPFDGQTEYTLLMIKPDATAKENEICVRLAKEGFLTLQRRKVLLSPEQASLFYEQLYGDPKFPRLVAYVASAPIVAVALTRERAICRLRELLGPKDVREARKLYPECMRAKYGHKRDSMRNALHGSDNPEKAEFEIHFFFPELTLYPLWTGEKATSYLELILYPTLINGLVEVARVKPIDPVVHLAHWLLHNNPNRPSVEELMALLPT